MKVRLSSQHKRRGLRNLGMVRYGLRQEHNGNIGGGKFTPQFASASFLLDKTGQYEAKPLQLLGVEHWTLLDKERLGAPRTVVKHPP